MNAERLLGHYHRIADAPGAIERLRRFMRDLAVRGKLVPQDQRDEHVSDVLKGLVTPRLGPFDVPVSWAWVTVGDVAVTRLGKMLDKAKNKGTPRRYLRNSNVRWFDFDMSDVLEMRFEDCELDEFALRSGDVLICEGGEPGRAAVWDERENDIFFQKAIHRARFNGFVSSSYFVKALRASADDGRLQGSFTGTGIKHFTGKSLDAYLFPLPPLAEQHRIVARVDELMTLCDRLEAARAERETTRDRLTTSCVVRLNAPDPETFQADARFVLNALPALTTRLDQIKQLRQTLLKLALRGKLVPQDPNDEPASELLKRIREWQVEAISQKRIRAPRKPLAPITHPQVRDAKPDGWAWARLGQIIYIQSGDGLTAENMNNGQIPVFGGNGINGYHDQGNVDQETVVVGRVGYYCGSIHVTPPKAWVTDNAFITHFSHDEIYLRFLALLLSGTNLKEDESATAQPVISGSKIYPIIVGLPPFAEQKRIVAKVQELTALCDRLEASITHSGETRRRLLEALLREALNETRDAA